MSDADVFAKLSRILETHNFDDDNELDIDSFLHSGRDGGPLSPRSLQSPQKYSTM